ncbi:hypothetical protein N0V95_009829, partial [Ascochyta clinopodiicola]
KDRKWMCTWCQLRLCRGCNEVLQRVPGRELGVLLDVRREEEEEREREREGRAESNPKVLVEDVDFVEHEDEDEHGFRGEELSGEETERGRSMVRVDSREREA